MERNGNLTAVSTVIETFLTVTLSRLFNPTTTALLYSKDAIRKRANYIFYEVKVIILFFNSRSGASSGTSAIFAPVSSR